MIFSEKALGLTTFVTTDQKSTRKTPPIDDVCNNTQRSAPKSQHDKPDRIGGPENPAAVPVGGGGVWPGFETTHLATHQRPSPTGVKGPGGTGGPGCDARGRRRGLAGLREDTASHTSATTPHWCGGRRRVRRARLRCPWAVAGPGRASRRRAERSSQRGRLAGGPPPTGTQSSPAPTRRPEHPWGNKPQAAPRHRTHIQKRPPGTGWAYLSRLWESNPRPIHYE